MMENLQLPAQAIPILAEVDVAIIGGTFAGLASALQFSKQGKRVMVVESRTYLGSEMTATLSPWINLPEEKSSKLIETCINTCGKTINLGALKSVVFHLDQLKIKLEDELLTAGVQLLYASLPIALTRIDCNWNGLVIANKSGRQLIRCRAIVDASETAATTFLTSDQLKNSDRGKMGSYKRVLEFTNVVEMDHKEITVPLEIGIKDNKVLLYPGFHEKGHVYVEYEMSLPVENSPECNRVRETEGQKRGIALAEFLVHEVPLFHKALLCAGSNELKGPYVTKNPEVRGSMHVEQLALKHPNTWCFYKDFYENNNTDWLNPQIAAHYGERFAEFVTFERKSDAPLINRTAKADSPFEMRIPIDFLEREHNFGNAPEQVISFSKTANVLVSGGGSSGGAAAIVSAEEGMKTILVDLNPGLGGTGTFGGVDSYWFGKRHGYAEKITMLVHDVQKRIKYKGPKWNIEAKKYALLQAAERLGIDLMFNCITFGAILKGTQVCGGLVATRWGTCAIIADCVIDATGDGDLAAFAGAEFVYGSVRDHVVMWYSLAQYNTPGKLQNNFTSMVNVSDVQDYTRAILAGRRRWSIDVDGCHDHGIYVAPRESRHIMGDVVMTMSDQLLQRSWPDCINIHFSNHDMKGISEANWLHAGLIPPNLEIEIPFRMLLPKSLDGILVVGKAISATHDALPAIRMQSDLENLGGIAALAAAMAVKKNKLPRELDCRLLQERIVKEGLIPESILTREISAAHYTDEELAVLTDSIEVEEPLYEYSNMRMNEIYQKRIPFVEICTVGNRIIPFLETAYEKAEGIRKVRIAQALAMYGSTVGVPALISEIMSMLQGEQLPKRTSEILYVTMPPDHGAMPDVCYLLYSLGLTRDKRSIVVWKRVADLLSPSDEDFKDKWWGIFYYIHAICVGAERLGEIDAVTVLKQLWSIPSINKQYCYEGYQADFFLERRALLELAIGRALARCGSVKGYEILIDYLADVRSLLSKQAHTELKRLSGCEYFKDMKAWEDWLENEKTQLIPQPYLEQTDLVNENGRITRKITS